jgi:hypothetical protein
VTYIATAVGSGVHTLTAAYGGDPSHASSSGAFTETVSVGRGTLTVRHVKVAGETVSLALLCSGVTGAKCQVTVKLTIKEQLKGKKLIGTSARKKKRQKAKTKTVELGIATVTLTPGERKTLRLTLNRAGKRLLAQLQRMKVKLAITESGTAVSSQTLTFKATSKRRR